MAVYEYFIGEAKAEVNPAYELREWGDLAECTFTKSLHATWEDALEALKALAAEDCTEILTHGVGRSGSAALVCGYFVGSISPALECSEAEEVDLRDSESRLAWICPDGTIQTMDKGKAVEIWRPDDGRACNE